MFDGVSARYDLLNRLMTLGQDGHWRAALAAAVPARAIVVLDLCTGNGVSLHGLTRPGRLVLGIDVSMGMLEGAADALPARGWAPRLVCADGFRLPLRGASVDAVTIAFGIRNLRPRPAALAELRRVLVPGGTLAVLEACAPRPGWFATFHRLQLRVIVPLLGRLSPDPSAYTYLRDSVFEFGDGRPFEADLAAAGFEIVRARAFLLGATRLWITRSPSGEVQNARSPVNGRGDLPHERSGAGMTPAGWVLVQLVISALLTVALAAGLFQYASAAKNLPLVGWQRMALGGLLGVGLAVFAARSVLLVMRGGGSGRRR
ncbi:MAG: class I SAM-dependent methyltransferase [Candidatus Eisenbacteria bacterium]